MTTSTVDSSALARDNHTRTRRRWQVQAELMKVRTTKLWRIYLVGGVVFTAWALLRNGATHHYELYPPLDQFPPDERAGAAVQAVTAATPAGHAAIAADMLTSGQFLGVLLAMLLGVLIVTNEYGHQTAATTFLTNPHRGSVVAAKMVAAGAFALLFWAVSTVIDVIATPFYLNSQHASTALTGWVPVRSVLLSLLVYVMWAIFGVGLGSLFRGQVGAVVVAMVVYLGGAVTALGVVNLIYLMYHHMWILGAAVIAPAVASLVMITPGRAFDGAPAQWVGLLVMTGYTLLLATVGAVQLRRRDI
jgi:ABC-type transport system involved in multi-copper enzyme maturation permease subunit